MLLSMLKHVCLRFLYRSAFGHQARRPHDFQLVTVTVSLETEVRALVILIPGKGGHAIKTMVEYDLAYNQSAGGQ